MALNDYTVTHTGTGPTLAAPTVSETILAPTDRTALLVVIGATATTVTITQPTTDAVGLARTSKTTGALSNTTRVIKVDANFIDPTTGNAAVTFSQVTGVTASVIRIPV